MRISFLLPETVDYSRENDFRSALDARIAVATYRFPARRFPRSLPFVGNIIKTLWTLHPPRFWLVWITTVAAAVVYVTYVIGQTPTRTNVEARKPLIDRILPSSEADRLGSTVAIALIAVFLVFYSAMILVWEDFADHDDSMFILTTLKGQNFGLTFWPVNGRFFPFALLEFNLVRYFTNTDAGYHILPIVQVLIFSCILLALDTDLSVVARTVLALLTLLTPSVLFSFSTLGFEERNLLFFLLCLILSVLRFEQTRSLGWALGAVLCGQIMLYYKETAFLLLLGFAVGRLVVRCIQARNPRFDYGRLWEKESRLDLCLASLALMFVVSYFAVMGVHTNINYVYEHRLPLKVIVENYLSLDLMVWLFVSIVVYRIYLILCGRTAPVPLWDGLACGGMVFFLGYCALRMFSPYYLAPVDLIAILYVGRCVLLSHRRMPAWSKAAAVLLMLAVVFQNLSLSTFIVFERKNAVHAKVELASVIQAQRRIHAENSLRLFFPFANPYVVMEFAYYLGYRGIPLNRVVLTARAMAHDGRCVNYRDLVCHAAREPSPGDLVIVVPEDEASDAEASAYRGAGESLISYEPRPAIPQWLYSVVGGLPLAAAKFTPKARPDRWMDASVTLWTKTARLPVVDAASAPQAATSSNTGSTD